jgi:glucose-6-phosphate 1-dehydrogenase
MNNKKIRLYIFGGTGDLSRKKLFPSLFQLYRLGLLPKEMQIVGVGRRSLTKEDYRVHISKNIIDENIETKVWEVFSGHIEYRQCDINNCADFSAIEKLNDIDFENVYYLALPPHMHSYVLNMIRNRQESSDRIVIEKPFGYDYESAVTLNKRVKKNFREEQIFRIDHYLAKETVQNIFAFRFSNGIFEPIWNRKYIDSVYIEATETIGVENRSKYFDKAGIVKDMMQSHLLQLMAIVAMDLPKAFNAEAIRDQKVSVFKAIDKKIFRKKIDDYYIKGQYDGYLDEPGVEPDSKTPTFAAMKIFIDNRRWKKVPFYLVTGKKMKEASVQIVINFKEPAIKLFGSQHHSCGMQNQIRILIQPNEKICLRFGAKKPGEGMVLEPVNMKFEYKHAFEEETVPSYTRLLLDIFKGDQSLFARNDGVENSWKAIDSYEKASCDSDLDIEKYVPGSMGPDINRIFDGECHQIRGG